MLIFNQEAQCCAALIVTASLDHVATLDCVDLEAQV